MIVWDIIERVHKHSLFYGSSGLVLACIGWGERVIIVFALL